MAFLSADGYLRPMHLESEERKPAHLRTTFHVRLPKPNFWDEIEELHNRCVGIKTLINESDEEHREQLEDSYRRAKREFIRRFFTVIERIDNLLWRDPDGKIVQLTEPELDDAGRHVSDRWLRKVRAIEGGIVAMLWRAPELDAEQEKNSSAPSPDSSAEAEPSSETSEGA